MTNLPQIIEYSNIRVLTTEQLAELYGTDTNNIKLNFNRNKDKYMMGKHYFLLEGEDLKTFKNHISLVGKRAASLYLWTLQGCLNHYDALRCIPPSTLKCVKEYFKIEDGSMVVAHIQRGEGELLQKLLRLLEGIDTVIPQYCIGNYRIDFYLPESNVAIEYDERHHKINNGRDRDRQTYIENKVGCVFIRVTEEDDFSYVANRIMKIIIGNK